MVHHATAGDLDRRGVGDVPTLTVAEYHSLPWRKRLAYRLFRNPLVMFTLGPLWSMLIGPRMVSRKSPPQVRASVIRTNIALAVLVGALCAVVGWQEYLLVQGPSILMAASAGVWLFYVQHQFEDVYWESSDRWSYADAALRGSSHLVLPKVLQFFSGNIGLHHVHHLSARIPQLQPSARPRRESDAPRRPNDLPARRHPRDPAEAVGRRAAASRDVGGSAGHP